MRIFTPFLLSGALIGCQFGPTKASSRDEAVDQGIDFLLPESAFTTPVPTLKWGEHDDASIYLLAVATDDRCANPVQVYRVKTTERALTHLENGAYHACLRALDAQGKAVAQAKATFRIRAEAVADPRSQNSAGGSGAALSTNGLSAFPLYLGEDMGSPSAFGAFADPNDDDRLKLFVNDRTHRRVLVYDGMPSRGDAKPSRIIGRAVKGASAKGFNDNVHVSVCPNGRVLVTDRGNHRIMVYKEVPKDDHASADLVIGQPDFARRGAGTGPANLREPAAAYCMEDRLVILDRGNHRILVYDKFPTKNGVAADYVIGQPDMATVEPGCGAAQLNSPSAAVLADGQFFVADSGNHRVVAYNGFPKSSGAKASLVLGQKNLANCKANTGSKVSAKGLDTPSSLAVRDGVLAVGDPGNHRVVFYFAPLASGKAAEQVLGQPGFDTHAATTSGQLRDVASAKALLFDGNYLWVADQASRSLSVLPLPY